MKPDLSLEEKFSGIVVGIDEAGRGPWAGPVVAGAVILDRNNIADGINDSKKLSKAKREELFDKIIQSAKVGIGFASAEEIDALNILQATKLAMVRAYEELGVDAEVTLVDGNQKINLPCQIQTVIKGDAISLSIAAASIIAKVTRDRLMEKLAAEHPEYGWQNNSGYGTKQHQDALAQFGITRHHRKSFKPIALLVAS